jgi:hypothetical protein
MDQKEVREMFKKVKLLRKPALNAAETEKKYGINPPYGKNYFKNTGLEEYHNSIPSVIGGKKKMKKEEEGEIKGFGFFDDFVSGFKQGFSGVMDVAKTVAPFLPLVGLGKNGEIMEVKRRGRPRKIKKVEVEIKKMVKPDKSAFESSSGEEVKMEAGKKKKKGLNDKMKRRMAKVKEIMADRKCSMIDASKIIKKEGLDY